ncbi:restriction endonuclease subunit S [Bifidobacterium adolescentis]|nr:restriction endonuclease subunit S [Bifidobacterium adolescentis]
MRLGDICTIKYGKDHKKLNDGDIPLYGSGGVMRHVEKALWSKPSVLIPRKGTLGNLFFVNKPFWTVDTCFWTDIDEEQVLPEYLFYQLKTKDLASLNVGTAVPSLTTDVLNEVQIDLPSLEKQKQVVEMLGSLDSKIEINTQLNGYLLELASTIFKTWFMNDDARYSTNKVAISEIAVINAGGDKPNVCQKTPSNKCPVPVYSNGTDNEGLYGYTSMAKVTEPSVTVSARGTIGFTCLRHQPYYPIVRLISATPKEGITVEYLYLWLRNKMITGVGTTQQQLTVPMFKKYEIDVPSARNLTKFTEIVRPLFNAIAANKTENTELVELRNALLPKLMSGEIDVSKIDLTQLNSHLA